MGGQHVALLQCQAFQRDRLGGLAVAAGKTQQGGVRLPARQIFQNVADAPTAPRGLNGEGVVTAHGQLPRELSTTPKTPRPVKAEALSGPGRGGTNAPARVRPSYAARPKYGVCWPAMPALRHHCRLASGPKNPGG